MRPLEAVKVTLAGAWCLVLLIFVIQNWGTAVTLVIAGSSGGSLPLSIAVLGAYLLGGGVGAVLVGSWRLHDHLRLRQAERLLLHMEDRMYTLEQQQYRQEMYLPSQKPDQPPPAENPEGFPPPDDSYAAAMVDEDRPDSPFDWRDLGQPRREDAPESNFDWRDLGRPHQDLPPESDVDEREWGEPRRWDY